MMTKDKFLEALAAELASLSEAQRQEVLAYFTEYLTDLEESQEGLSSLGSPEAVAKEIVSGLQEQDILSQVPQTLTTAKPVLTAIQNLQVSITDIGVAVMSAPIDEIRVHCSEQLRQLLDITEEAGCLSIKQVKAQEKSINIGFRFSFGKWSSSHQTLELLVPEGQAFQAIDLATHLGDVSVEGLVAETLSLNSRDGDASVTDCQLEQLAAQVTNGDLTLTRTRLAKVTIDSSNGDLSLDNCETNQLSLSLQNGDFEMADSHIMAADLSLQNGDWEGQNVRADNLIAKLQNGDVSLEGLVLAHQARIENHSGDVTLTLSNPLSDYHLLVETHFGDYCIQTPKASVTGDNGRYELEGSSTSPSVMVTSHFGDIAITA